MRSKEDTQHDSARRMAEEAKKTGEPERDPNLTAEVAGRPADEKRAVAQAKVEGARTAEETAAASGAPAPEPQRENPVKYSIEQALHELSFPATKDRIIAVARAGALEQTERYKLERIPDASYPDMESLLRAVSQVA